MEIVELTQLVKDQQQRLQRLSELLLLILDAITAYKEENNLNSSRSHQESSPDFIVQMLKSDRAYKCIRAIAFIVIDAFLGNFE